MSPRVAVITPTYQHAAFIEACVQSVIAQTEPDWEMVVVDDGSPDGTADLVDRIVDPRVRLVRQEHHGLGRLGEAYAAALAMTSAPLVAVLEGDDTWPPDKLARQLRAFHNPTVVMSYGAAALIDRDGVAYATYDRRIPAGSRVNDPTGSIIPYLAPNNFIVAATVIVRRDVLERVGGFIQPEGIPFVDHPTWLRVALEGRFAHSTAVVGHWRRHPGQYTTEFAAAPAPDPTQYVAPIVELAQRRGLVAVDPAVINTLRDDDGRRRRLRAIAGAGRLQLLAGEWGVARDTFRSLASEGVGRSGLVLGLAGWFASIAHRDLEWLFRSTGRLSWPPRR